MAVAGTHGLMSRNPGVPCDRRSRPCGDLVAHAEGSARSATMLSGVT